MLVVIKYCQYRMPYCLISQIDDAIVLIDDAQMQSAIALIETIEGYVFTFVR